MTDAAEITAETSPARAPKGRVEFIDNHLPALPSGDYQIEAAQTIAAARHDRFRTPTDFINTTRFAAATRDFSVAGPRFALDPQVIRSVFPAAGSLGEHSNVLPHISFNRSTLPWERSLQSFTPSAEEGVGEADRLVARVEIETPWLALLVFDETEIAGKSERTNETGSEHRNLVAAPLSAYTVSAPRSAMLTADGTTRWSISMTDGGPKQSDIEEPWFLHEFGQEPKDPLTVIDVGGDLFRSVLPSESDVRLLAHVRVPTDAHGTALDADVATILANRLPQPGRMTTVHLVSLESRYGSAGHTLWTLPSETKFVRLVSLHSWRFACIDQAHSFKGLLHHLNTEQLFELDAKLGPQIAGGTLSGVPSDIGTAFAANGVSLGDDADIRPMPESSFSFWQVTDGDDRFVIRHHGGKLDVLRALPNELRRPSHGKGKARARLEHGYIPLPHEMRQGNRSVSWYRGPLTPCTVKQSETLLEEGSDSPQRVSHADELVRYDPHAGMFDVSYAAAWELGRQLTLQNEKVAMSLFSWKRHHRLVEERRLAMAGLEHLPVVGRPVTSLVPPDVADWFRDLALLRDVPFNYLVADETLLPPESIRFFSVDPEWVRCLHEGAFSVGRVLPSDRERDQAQPTNSLRPPHGSVTGFLLRSEVVSGWPDLLVDGYHENITHRGYEPDRLVPEPPIIVPATNRLIGRLNCGVASGLGSLLGLDDGVGVEVQPIVENSSWTVNVSENKTIYVLERRGDQLHLTIENKLPHLRFERLSPTILLVLFAGEVRTVDIHEKPEGLHFGVDAPGDDGTFTKKLRNSRGQETSSEIRVPFRSAATGGVGRVIEVDKLHSQAVAALHPDYRPADNAGATPEVAGSGGFALQMTVGVQKVRFSECLISETTGPGTT